MQTSKCLFGLFLIFCMYSEANSIKFDQEKNKGTVPEGQGFGLKDQGFESQHSASEPRASKGGFFGFSDLKAGFDKEKNKFESKFGLKFEANLEIPQQQKEKSKFSEFKEKVDVLKSSLVDKFSSKHAAKLSKHAAKKATVTETVRFTETLHFPETVRFTETLHFPESVRFTETVQRPICPLSVKPIYEVEVVEQNVHSIEAWNENFDSTVWTHVTETLHLPVTVFQRTTSTKEAQPIYITETQIVPEYIDITKAKILTVEHPITSTNLQISTYTATNTWTSTLVEPVWITVTDIQTQWVTSTDHVVKTTVEWISATETVTQPIYVTTSIWVEAPQLVLDTTTITSPHYMTTTEYVTKVVHSTVCEH